MFNIVFACFLPTLVFSASIDVTFKNVEFKGFSVFTLKFKKTIVSAESLKSQLPEGIYDHIEFANQNIPVLKKNSISDIEDLDELTIENCNLKEIQAEAFKNLPALRKLSLKSNQLEEINEGIFNHLEVSMLDLSNNRITNVEASAMNNMPNLLNINLADNLIQYWDRR